MAVTQAEKVAGARNLEMQPPTGGAWLHEIKHDGFRIIARKPPRQRCDLALIRRGWLEYPLTDLRQFGILWSGRPWRPPAYPPAACRAGPRAGIWCR
jgi:hypothetical protein